MEQSIHWTLDKVSVGINRTSYYIYMRVMMLKYNVQRI
jgi:hypothetical protein